MFSLLASSHISSWEMSAHADIHYQNITVQYSHSKEKRKGLLSFFGLHINACDADVYICNFKACHIFNG